MNERLILFDTTLRDGEQAPGFSMNLDEKLRMASALDQLGVDVIEAGFPAASIGDFESVREVARRVERARVAGLCRCHATDIERAFGAVGDAQRPRLHTFLATSPIHREHKLGMTRDEVVARVREGVARCRALTEDVEFSAEDASRTEPEFLVEVFQVAAEAGATTLNVPDTVGYALPHETEELFRYLTSNVACGDGIIFSAHCHDDLGLAVAGSLGAVRGGARQVEATICGIGERAGNAALEEVAMAVRTRNSEFSLDVGIDSTRLFETAQTLQSIVGQVIPRNKAIVGRNAFSHEAGIHQHGVISHRETYEILSPADVGQVSRLVLGKHSGRHALGQRLVRLGHEFDDAELDRVFEAFKELADRKKEVHDEDLRELLLDTSSTTTGPWTLEFLQTTAGTNSVASAVVRIAHEGGETITETAAGDGPVDACFQALARATGCDARIHEFLVQSVTIGEDAQGRVTVCLGADDALVRGQGVSTDIVEASGLALLDAINRSSVRIGRDKAVPMPVVNA